MIVLEIVEGNCQGQVFELSETCITIGRAEENTVALTDYHLSGDHGQIFVEGDQYIYRDLRSTNGSLLRRGDESIAIDGEIGWEITLHEGDILHLGNTKETVAIRIQRAGLGEPDSLTDRVIASRAIVDLPEVAERVEHDPASAIRLYKALQPLSSRLEMAATLEAVVDAMFTLLPRATNISVLLRGESDKDRFTVAVSRSRTRDGRAVTETESVRASRAVLRRVLADRAGLLTANALEELSTSESILAGQIQSMLAVPLWRGDEIRGLIQVDNRASAGMFTEGDLEVALIVGAQSALALDNAALVSKLQVAEERLRGENHYLKRREENLRFDDIIGESDAMQKVLKQLQKVLDTRATVCIQGETGTGKELIASGIHYQSKRRDKMFVAQNCAAMPETLLESELFGHTKGAFTNADTDKKGLFEIAHGGTLFLDEVGEMPLSLQAKLLRVLQEGTIRPIGSTTELQIDVRIICATNRNLESEVEAGKFRQDLYYRLMVFPVELPPLRERGDDISLLAKHFLARYCAEYGCSVAGFSEETLDTLTAFAWPGNIRELENEVQRLVIQAEPGSWIEVADLSQRLRKAEGTLARTAPKKGTLKEMISQVERALINEALRDNDGNKTRTAQALGITREGLHKKLAKWSA